MNDFENQNNTNGLDENENTGGSVSGFDEVNGNGTGSTEQDGYTVTSQGGFYTKKQSDIIQDEAFIRKDGTNNGETQSTEEPQGGEGVPNGEESQNSEENNRTDFRPNGTYGSYNQGNRNQESYNQGSWNGVYSNPYAPKKPKAKKKHTAKSHSTATVILSAVLAAVIGAVSSAAITGYFTKDKSFAASPQSNGSSQNVNINVDETVSSLAEAVAAKATASVVGIRTTTSVISFFGGTSDSTGEGSGVIYSADGYIITNYHVIESAAQSENNSKIEVFIGNVNEKPYEASVVGYNISCDLAVLKIDAKNLSPAELGTSADLKVGQYVVTIGSPGGLEFMGSVTYGVISGLDRTMSNESTVSLIQTDAAINPGNSGGALLNAKGQLIGINNSKIVAEEFENMAFAIPVDTVKEKCDKIISRKNSPEPYLGISISTKYTASVLEYYGYPVGAVVQSVDSGSPASEAGIERGDIITEFNGTKITQYSMFGDLLNDSKPGEKVSIKIYRSGRYYTTTATVGANNLK